MKYSIIPTASFRRDFKELYKKYASLKSDIEILEKELSKNPFIGDDLGENFRKIRVAIKSKNKGKRGGARVITYNLIINTAEMEVYLLALYSKGETDTISKQEIIELKNINNIL